jgi:DNA repair exonuclease SbcCD ATPase subunit
VSLLSLNTRNTQAANAERNAREKEEAYNREQVAKKRNDELNQTIQKLVDEVNSIEKGVAPLKASRINKETQRDAMRKANSIEETGITEELRTFEKDAQRLHDVTEKIEEYLRSNKERDMEQLEAQLLGNVNMMKEDEAKLDAMKPVIEQLKKQVDDGERQKAKIEVSIHIIYTALLLLDIADISLIVINLE